MRAFHGGAEGAEYRDYCRCWQTFLERIASRRQRGDAAFTAEMTLQAARYGTSVKFWPTNWAEIEIIFQIGPQDGPERFVEAVHAAERARRGPVALRADQSA